MPFVLHTPFSLENCYLQLWDILALIRQLFSLSVAGFVLALPFPLQSVLVLRTPLHPFVAVSDRALPDSPHLVPALQAPGLPGSHLHCT